MPADPAPPSPDGAEGEEAGSVGESRSAVPETSAGPPLPEPAPVQQMLRQPDAPDAHEAQGRPQAPEETASEDPAAASGRLQRPVWRRLRGSGLVAVIAALATAVALAALLVALRGPILAIMPASAGFYATFGLLPDPLGAGLEIRDVSTTRAREGSAEVLTVSGVIANVIDARADVPFLRVSLYDAGDRQLQAVDLPGPRVSLKPAESVGFDVRISDLQPATRRVRVGFTAPPDPDRR